MPLLLLSAMLAGCSNDASTGTASEDVTSEPDVFAESSVLSLKLEGAFSTAFSAASAGIPNGPLPGLPKRTFEERPGTLSWVTSSGEAKSLPITFKVRGNSSLHECPFPKLTVKLTDEGKAAAKNTMFAKNTKFKVGTHCGDFPDGVSGTVGRLRNEKSPLREGVAYQAVAAVVPMALATRPLRVTYVDTANDTTTERNALLLEHVEKLAKRSGAPDEYCRMVDGAEECDPVLSDAELFKADPREGMDRKRIAALTLLHAALGNWDWELSVAAEHTDGSRVWNHDVLLVTEGTDVKPVPVAQDFDLASMITGGRRKELTPAELRAQAKEFIGKTAGLTPDEVAGATSTLLERKDALYAVVAAATVDDAGRAIARAHLDAFYAELK